MKNNVAILLVIIIAGVTLAACNRKADVDVVESPLVMPSSVSPLKAQQPTSPIPIPTPETAVLPPSLDEPIYAGNTAVLGSGPVGLPIRLYDVGLTGDELGNGVIGKDGTFSIDLNTTLQAGQRVGLALGDLEGTSFTYTDLEDQAIISLPIIGLLFADVTVQPQP